MPSTKIEFNCNKIARIQGLDDLAQLLFPGVKGGVKVRQVAEENCDT